jgi:two-component system, OmpR family, phosphate regulon response regulator PhoB
MMTESTILVDDEADSRIGLAQFLQEEGFHVLTAANGHQALHLLEQLGVDLLLIDVMMPNLTGPQAVEVMRTRRIARRTAIDYMSAHGNIETHGVVMLRKPFDLDDLHAIVESRLR